MQHKTAARKKFHRITTMPMKNMDYIRQHSILSGPPESRPIVGKWELVESFHLDGEQWEPVPMTGSRLRYIEFFADHHFAEESENGRGNPKEAWGVYEFADDRHVMLSYIDDDSPLEQWPFMLHLEVSTATDLVIRIAGALPWRVVRHVFRRPIRGVES